MKKILFLTPWFPHTENPIYGTFIKEHLLSVKQQGYEVGLINFHDEFHGYGSTFHIEEESLLGIPIIRLRTGLSVHKKKDILKFIYHFLQTYRQFTKKHFTPDIIHANVYYMSFFAFFIKLFFRKPYIVSEHAGAFLIKIPPKQIVRTAKYFFPFAEVVTAVSRYHVTKMKQLGIKANYGIVSNVIDMNNVFQQDKHNQVQIIAVANLIETKGIQDLFDALFLLKLNYPNLKCEIIGDGPYRKQLEEKIIELELDNIVTLHGLQSKKNVSEYLSQASVFVLPSYIESFGVVYMEALASGIPVVAYDIPVLQELLPKEYSVLVETGNIEKLKEAIEYMISNYQNYDVSRMRLFVEERYSSKIIGQKFADIYESIGN